MLELEDNHNDMNSMQQTLGMGYAEDEDNVDWGLELNMLLADDCMATPHVANSMPVAHGHVDALAVTISAEEERQRQERDEAAKTGEAGGAAPAGSASLTPGAMMDAGEDMLQQALAMSMGQAHTQPTHPTRPAASNLPARLTNEDDEVSRFFHRGIGEAQTENREDADFFELIEGTQKRRNGQNKAAYVCKCCPRSRFGYESEKGTWSLDLGRQVHWASPITCRTSDKEFKRTCHDHVQSKNRRHMFWDTVERVDKEMTTSGSASPSQQDLENLAAFSTESGNILLDVFDIYVGYVKDYEKNGDKKIIDCEKKGVEEKFEQAHRVLQKLKIVNSPFTFRFPDCVVEVVNGAGGSGEEYPQLQVRWTVVLLLHN